MAYEVSIVMPSLNEQGNIVRAVENVVHAFEKLNVTGEIVVVDDGSRDRTGELVDGLSQKYSFVRKLRHDRPMGVGRSYWDGVNVATGEVVTMMPGDGENDAEEILRYLPLTKDVDVVVPFVFNLGSRSWIRQMISALYRACINLAFGTQIKYFNGTVLYRRTILRGFELRSNGFFYQTELIIKCMTAQYLYAEVPYGLLARGAGVSKALSFRSLFRVMRDFAFLKWELWTAKGRTELESTSVSYRRRRQFEAPGTAPALQPTLQH